MSVGLFNDHSALLHKNPYDSSHPEKPERITKILNKFDESGLNIYFSHFSGRHATRSELLKIHSHKYIDILTSLASQKDRVEFMSKLDDVYVNEYSVFSALTSAGMSIDAANALLLNKLKHAIVLTRPPGHHAHKDHAAGFCLINNIALAASVIADAEKKVAIFDWDVHHGDGTVNIVNGKKNIIMITIQRYDKGKFYPATGKTTTQNNIMSIGFNGSINGHQYIKLFNEKVLPVFTKYKPDVICISAGFDTSRNDKMGGCELDEEDYKYMTSKLMKIAPQILVCLEGGYDLESLSCGMRGVAYELLKDVIYKK